MNPIQEIRGAGGGGGGGGGGGSEASDTLRSTQVADVLDLISEGECEGLVNGLKSIYLDGVPLQAADGSFNFQGVQIETTPGTQGQAAIGGADGVQNEIGVGVSVVFATPIVRTISNPAVDTCRITIVVGQLSRQDTKSGDLGGSKFQWAVEVQSAGGGYVEQFRETVDGKTMSRYPRAKQFKLRGAAPWDVRVRRLTADSTTASEVNAFAWQSYTEIQTLKLRYPNSCLIRTRVNAQQFARIPTRSFDWLGQRVQVPSNYDPKTRVYTGIWDGTFKIAWTDNPAWEYHDMVTQNRYGLGRYVTVTDALKWELYAIGRYCDVMVPDGYGRQEPRFRASPGFDTREQAYKVLTDLAAIFRGIVFWMNDGVSVAQDAPSDPVAIYTPANVVPDGPGRCFAYTGSSNAKRYSSVIVWFNDLAQQGKLVPEVYVDPLLEATLGVKPLELSPLGIWSRGQAQRIGKWALYTQEEEAEAVGFKVGLDGVLVQPGKTFQIADPNEAGERLAGRVHAASTVAVALDAEVTLRAGEAYTLTAMLHDPADATRLVPVQRGVANNPGPTRTIVLATPLPSVPAAETVWLLQSDAVSATNWRCVGVADNQDGTFTVSGIAHQPRKYDLIELGIQFEKASISRLSLLPEPPTDMTFVEAPYLVGTSVYSRLTVSWVAPAPGLTYLLSWRLNTGPWSDVPATQSNSFDIDALATGNFEARVRSRNALGYYSALTLIGSTLVTGEQTAPHDSGNLVRTPSFEGGLLATWSNGGAIAEVAGQAWSKALLVSIRDLIEDYAIPMGPGETLYTAATLSSVDTQGAPVAFGVVCYDKAGAVVSFLVGSQLATGNDWARIAGKLVTSPGTASVKAWLQINKSPTDGGFALATNLYLGRYEPGATFGADWATNVLGAGGVNQAISAARAAADAAVAEAEAANQALAQIASDNVLSAGEKPAVILDYTKLVQEQPGIDMQAANYGITVERTPYDDSLAALSTYLGAVTTPTYWSDLTGDSYIDGPAFRAKFANAYLARQQLLNRIAAAVVGGRNLVRYSNDFSKCVLAPGVLGDSYQTDHLGGHGATRLVFDGSSTQAYRHNAAPLRIGATYTVSVWVKPEPPESASNFCLSVTNTQAYNTGGFAIAYQGGWQRLTTHILASTSSLDVIFGGHSQAGQPAQSPGSVLVAFLQVEEGEVATQWGPSPDDVAEAIAAAQAAADSARISADIANQALARIASDNVLSAGEKPAVILDYTQIAQEQPGINAQYPTYQVAAELGTYNAAIYALGSYLNGLTTPTYWSDLSGDTNIDGTTFRNRFADVYAARQAVLNRIAMFAYGATFGINVNGQITAATATTYIGPSALPGAVIGKLTAANLTIPAISGTINGGLVNGARMEFSANSMRVYDSTNTLRVKVGDLS